MIFRVCCLSSEWHAGEQRTWWEKRADKKVIGSKTGNYLIGSDVRESKWHHFAFVFQTLSRQRFHCNCSEFIQLFMIVTCHRFESNGDGRQSVIRIVCAHEQRNSAGTSINWSAIDFIVVEKSFAQTAAGMDAVCNLSGSGQLNGAEKKNVATRLRTTYCIEMCLEEVRATWTLKPHRFKSFWWTLKLAVDR